MRRTHIGSVLVALLGLTGCGGALPDVANAYGDQFGAVETSPIADCPTIEGVWHLSDLSAGSLLQEDGELVPHFRWFAPYLFGLSANARSYIAIEPRSLETVFYLADRIPGAGASSSAAGYTTLDDTQAPCVGHGWRRIATRNHSLNDAAARVLNLDVEEPVNIVQTDYVARTADDELVLAIRIDYSGTDSEDKTKKINDGYWHWLKMPRLHEDPKAQGFKS